MGIKDVTRGQQRDLGSIDAALRAHQFSAILFDNTDLDSDGQNGELERLRGVISTTYRPALAITKAAQPHVIDGGQDRAHSVRCGLDAVREQPGGRRIAEFCGRQERRCRRRRARRFAGSLHRKCRSDRRAGGVAIDGSAVTLRSARDAARAGLALVPEDRQRLGLLFNLTLRHNLVLPRAVKAGVRRIREAEEDAVAREQVANLSIKTPSLTRLPDTLSGGNQQKIVAGKWLATAPSVLLLDEPTKGVDVGAKF